jgi:exopolysaccharide biosynthesis polyprenyl glycosylphosphotransferase
MEPEIVATPSEPRPEVSARIPVTAPAVSMSASTLGAPSLGSEVANGSVYANGHPAAHTSHGAGAHVHLNGAHHRLGDNWGPSFHASAEGHALPAESPRTFYLRFGKRAIDVVGAVAALILLSPLMAAIAVAIKLESRGSVLYRSTRIGRGGRAFTFIKFRSMISDADRSRHQISHLNESDGPTFKIRHDPRVTRIGRFLRETSLDEIPQFVNVLRGEMSLVGPRPPIPAEVEQYEPWQMRRLDVSPGITCLWQISGRSNLSFREWMRLDLEYIKHRSFWMDLRILLRTIPAVLSREGAY